jgi:hypothetical protein
MSSPDRNTNEDGFDQSMQQSRYRFINRDNEEQVRATLGVSTLRPWGLHSFSLCQEGTNMVCHGRKVLQNTKEHSRQLGNGESSNLILYRRYKTMTIQFEVRYNHCNTVLPVTVLQNGDPRRFPRLASIVHCFDDIP